MAAGRPQEFLEVRQDDGEHFVVPNKVPTQWRHIPTIRLADGVIAKNSVNLVESLDPLVVGYVNSRAYALWCEVVDGGTSGGGRSLPPGTTYNTFPFPELGEEDDAIRDGTKALMLARSYGLIGTLDDLYGDPELTPEPVKKAHAELDRRVASAFGLPVDATDDELREALFLRYDKLTTTQPEKPPSHRQAA